MLRRLDLTSQWRSLEKNFWPDDLPLGRGTVIYGHNGSGKSTLAELLLRLGEGQAETGVIWEQDDKQKVTVPSGNSSPSNIAVFTRAWVEANLSEFLAGDNADAIVTLGKDAIDSKEEEEKLEDEIRYQRGEADSYEELRKNIQKNADKLAREVQERIVNELQRFDHKHYSKNRYSITKVIGMLRETSNDFPDDAAHSDALVMLGEGAPSTVRNIASPPTLLDGMNQLGSILSGTPARIAIEALEANPRAQAWVEQGQLLHEERQNCFFCDGTLYKERRRQLARHFDESWVQIRSDAQQLLTRVQNHKENLISWVESLPTHSFLSSDLQLVYKEAVESVSRSVTAQMDCLNLVEESLSAKVADPNFIPDEPEYAVLGTTVSVSGLLEILAEHNERARRHEELTARRKTIVLDYIVGSKSQSFRDLERQVTEARESKQLAVSALDSAERKIEIVRQEQFTTKEMADNLTRDLARVYGKQHLSIAVTDDGKSYTCRRGDGAGTNLSEGERTTLSLLYFLRSLEDQQNRGFDPKQRIVVIDDPSSSLDRESLFATHQWLVSTLKDFGQYIVLTHDFNLLRLFILSHNNKWNASAKAIDKGDANEIRFPRVSFLELYAATVAGRRTTKIGQLSPLLRSSTSEYAFLFNMVMKGVQDTEDHERLFLLPNAARRLLETFASYKAPHRPNFIQQLEVLVKADPNEPYRDVYDFCNRFSHGEGNETAEVLDARTVHGQIRRCMEFLRAVDEDHFVNMCTAIKMDPAVLA